MFKKISIFVAIVAGLATIVTNVIQFQRSCEPRTIAECISEWREWARAKQEDMNAAADRERKRKAAEDARRQAAEAKRIADEAEDARKEEEGRAARAADERRRAAAAAEAARKEAEERERAENEQRRREQVAAEERERAEAERRKREQAAEAESRRRAELLSRAKQQIQGLEIAVTSVHVSRDEIRVALRLANQDATRPMAIACYAQGSDGIADFWKFMPQTDAMLADEAGGKYSLRFQSPCLGYGRDGKDWTVIHAGKSVDAILSFGGATGVGSQLSLSLSVRLSIAQISGNAAQFGTPNRAAVVIREIPSFQGGSSGGNSGSSGGNTAWLGVRLQEVTRDMADALGMKEAYGALVSDLPPDGPGAKAGMRVKDVIISFNGQRIAEPTELSRLVGTSSPGASIELRIVREGQEKTINVTLGRR